ncbi:MAG: hypothetical protein KDC54_16315, partial [Lewinella sp.]|nr:hypothetical protein [Lewinella sp.]
GNALGTCNGGSLIVNPGTYYATYGGANCESAPTMVTIRPKPAQLTAYNCQGVAGNNPGGTGNCEGPDGEPTIRLFTCTDDPFTVGSVEAEIMANAQYGLYVGADAMPGTELTYYNDYADALAGNNAVTLASVLVLFDADAATNMARTQLIWVTQSDPNTGCASAPAGLRLGMRVVPEVVITTPAPIKPDEVIDLFTLVQDDANTTEIWNIYDADPTLPGAVLLASSPTNAGGEPDGSESYDFSQPTCGEFTFWFEAINDASIYNASCTAVAPVTITVELNAGEDNLVLVCENWPNNLANDVTEPGGVFEDPNNTGALFGALFLPQGLAPGDYPINYVVYGPDGCEPDVAIITVRVQEGANAGEGQVLTICEGEIIDLYDLVEVPGGVFLDADPIPNYYGGAEISNIFDATGLGGEKIEILYRVGTEDPNAPCNVDYAPLTLLVRSGPSAPPTVEDLDLCAGESTLLVPQAADLPAGPMAFQATWDFEDMTLAGNVIPDDLSPSDMELGDGLTGPNFEISIIQPYWHYGSWDSGTGVSPDGWDGEEGDYFQFCLSVPEGTFDISQIRWNNYNGTGNQWQVFYSYELDGSGTFEPAGSLNFNSDPNVIWLIYYLDTGNPLFQEDLTQICYRFRAQDDNPPDEYLTFDNMIITGTYYPETPPSNFNFYDADPEAGPATLLAGGATSYDPMTAPGTIEHFWVTTTDGTCESEAVMVTVDVADYPGITCPNPFSVDISNNGTGDCSAVASWNHLVEENDACEPQTLTMSIDGGPPVEVIQGGSITETLD